MKFPGLIATVAFSVCGFVVFGWNSALSAQQTRPTNIRVQLPTVSFFNLRTVVSVPDAGVMSLGGVSRMLQEVPLVALPGSGRFEIEVSEA